MKKILILRPSYNAKGGISNYFTVLEKYFTFPVTFFIRGARKQPHKHTKLYLATLYFYDLIRFILTLSFNNYTIVHINTSLGVSGLYRDAAFLSVARFFKCKVLVFFRGLDQSFVLRASNDLFPLFRKYYFKADMIITLSKSFGEKLVQLGYKGLTKIETTVIDDTVVPYKTYQEILDKKKLTNLTVKLLFLARIEKNKGLYECIEAFQILKSNYNNLELIIAGDGNELERVKEYVNNKKISNIIFTGYVVNEQKWALLDKATIFILPSYREGMPNSVIEAMAFGLPIIATKVGGLPDIIIDCENGFLVDKALPDLIAEKVERLITDETLYVNIVKNNFLAAQKKFLASKIVLRLETYYTILLKS